MKNFIALIIFTALLAISSCTKQDAVIQKTPPPNALDGDWNLTSVTGGFAGANFNLGGTVIYNFDTASNVLSVINNYAGTAPISGLATGSYPFTISGSNQININSQGGGYTINNNQLIIDQGVAVDGYGYKFQRIEDCGIPNQCLSFSHAPVITAAVPLTGIVNNSISIPITFSVNNGCGSFGNITETNLGNTKTLVVNAKYLGCICTLAMGEIVTNYNFIPTIIGNQIIKIAQPDGSFLSYNINITN